MLIGYAGLRSVTALEIACRTLGQMPGLWLRRVSAPAIPRRDTSGRVRLVDVASVKAYVAGLRWTGAWCVVSPSVAWTPVGFTAPLQGAGSACASPAGPHGWRQHDGRLEGRRDVLVAVGGRDGKCRGVGIHRHGRHR